MAFTIRHDLPGRNLVAGFLRGGWLRCYWYPEHLSAVRGVLSSPLLLQAVCVNLLSQIACQLSFPGQSFWLRGGKSCPVAVKEVVRPSAL